MAVEPAGAVPVPASATEARKRRKAIITQHRGSDHEPPPSSSASSAAVSTSGTSSLPSSSNAVLPSSSSGGDGAAQVLRDSGAPSSDSGDEDRRSKGSTQRDGQIAGVPSPQQGGKADGENSTEHGEEDPAIRRRGSDGGEEWENDDGEDGCETQDGAGVDGSSDDRDGREHKKRGQIRYDPDVPMSKEQLAMWRRECRRVRNRESAAASRARVRSRIQELEGEVEDWKTKYAQAVQRLEHLQQIHQASAGAPAAANSGSI